MTVELISIGDELLIGRTINTNAAWLGENFSALGFTINRVSTISDSQEAIENSILTAIKDSKVVIVTGGLGPTKDDITKYTLCKMFDSDLLLHQEALKNVERFILDRGGEMNENNKNQALFPSKAEFIPNPCGTASGMWFTKNGSIIISLPGVPHEMKDMMEQTVFPRLTSIFTLPTILHEHVLVTGIPEAKLAEILEDWENNLPEQIKLAYLPSPGIVKLRLSCFTNTISEAKEISKAEIEKLKIILGDSIYGYGITSFEEIVGSLLLEQGLTISTAESCTGGKIASMLTSISGSSAYFVGATVAYSNNVKVNELLVQPKIIEKQGAVSKEVVEAMAKGCRGKYQTDVAIATSGIAGPTGGTDEKPVGTVWIAVATKDTLVSQVFQFGNNRERTVLRSCIAALNMTRKLITNEKN